MRETTAAVHQIPQKYCPKTSVRHELSKALKNKKIIINLDETKFGTKTMRKPNSWSRKR